MNRRTRRNHALSGQRKGTFLQDLGCTVAAWKVYLESKFRDGMSWENYGSVWHLDEIIPVSAWNLQDPDHWKACWHWTNSQPLLVAENLRKGGASRADYSMQMAIHLKALRFDGVI